MRVKVTTVLACGVGLAIGALASALVGNVTVEYGWQAGVVTALILSIGILTPVVLLRERQ